MPSTNGKDGRSQPGTRAAWEKAPGQKVQRLPQCRVYVSTEHPLVQQVIIGILQSDTTSRLTILPSPRTPSLLESDAAGVIIVDIDSFPCWKKLLPNWTGCGIRPIAIIARGAVEFTEY